MSDLKIPWWVWAIGAGGVAYILYKSLGAVGAAASTAVSTVSSGIANAWLSLPLVGLPPTMNVLGNVLLPNGTLVPLNSLQGGDIRNDTSNPPNVLANIQGTIYQLSPSNAQGNFPAALVGPAPAGA
jgi:hypothetical protein